MHALSMWDVLITGGLKVTQAQSELYIYIQTGLDVEPDGRGR